MIHASRALQSHGLSGDGINCGSHKYFLTPQGHGEPPMISDQLNSGATSETTRTLKTIQIIYSFILTRRIREVWVWRPNYIRGTMGPKASWHLPYRWGKTPKQTSPRKLVPTGNWIRARCVTGAHATAYSTTVGEMKLYTSLFSWERETCEGN